MGKAAFLGRFGWICLCGLLAVTTARAEVRDAGSVGPDAGADAGAKQKDAGAEPLDAGGAHQDAGAAGGVVADAGVADAAPDGGRPPKLAKGEAPEAAPALMGPTNPPVFAIRQRRIWPGETIALDVVRRDGLPVRVQRVILREEPQEKGASRWEIDLTNATIPAADGASLSIRLDGGADGISAHSFTLFAAHAFLCIEYQAEGTPAGGAEPYCAAGRNKGSAVQAIEVKLGDQTKALLWALAAILAVVAGFNLLVRVRGGGRFAEIPPAGTSKILYWFLRPATTSMGTYSLSLTQILVWSYVTLFGLVYVWCMSEDFLKISPDVLKLLGIGSATAVLSRAVSSSKTFVPQRYLALIGPRNRAPSFSDGCRSRPACLSTRET